MSLLPALALPYVEDAEVISTPLREALPVIVRYLSHRAERRPGRWPDRPVDTEADTGPRRSARQD